MGFTDEENKYHTTSDPKVFLERLEREFSLTRRDGAWAYNGKGSNRLADKLNTASTCIDVLIGLREQSNFIQFCIVIGRPVFFVLGYLPPFAVVTSLSMDDLTSVIDAIAISKLNVKKISILENAYLVELRE
jgi:hypothetical protein